MEHCVKVQHLNYSRQFAKFILETYAKIKNPDNYQKRLAFRALTLHRNSVKFLLPNGGRPLYDPYLRALDDTVPLRLPFPCIALEYECRGFDNPNSVIYNATTKVLSSVDAKQLTNLCTKRIAYAEEEEEGIYISIAYYSDDQKFWHLLPPVFVEKTNYLIKDVDKQPLIAFRADDSVYTTADYIDEVSAVLNFLNIMQCSNVKAEVSEPKKANVPKMAFGFDSYRILTIDGPSGVGKGLEGGSHRSPREHLRRGHIRRLGDGRKVWVNAAVVGAGKGAGVVHKDYLIGSKACATMEASSVAA
jgi:hypothetical protein